MSEEKKTPRTLEAIQQEYQQTCLNAGHVQYQLSAIRSDADAKVNELEKGLTNLNSKLRDLNIEAAASQKAEKEKAGSPEKPKEETEAPGSELKEQ